MDWLTIWGVNNSIGFFFKEILTQLSRDGAQDYTQILFKEYLDENLELSTRKNFQVVTGQLIKEFLALFQQELEDADLSDQELKSYEASIEKFIFNQDFQVILRNSFKFDDFIIDSDRIQQLWSHLELRALPNDFSWQRICKRFPRRVKFIWQQLEEAKDIDNSFDSTNIVDIDLLDTVNQNNDPLIKYKKLIQDYYGNLRLDSLDTSGAAYDQLKLWRIFIAQNVREVREFIPQVYEIPKEHQKMLRESGQLDEEELTLRELEEYNEFYSQQPLQSVLGVIAEPEDKQLVILGDPGSGKSTLLQYIALQWAELPDKELATSALPLLIELRTYNREKQAEQCHNLLEFFNSGSSIIFNLDRDYIQDKLKTGQATVLFDGLDEVFEPSQRAEVIAEIIQFTKDYPEARVIVSSRVIGYKQKTLAEEGFTHFMLQDLEAAQVDDFINRWHDLTFYDRVDKQRKRDRLKKAITESPAIQELSGNPLLLTMMAILNRNQELPRDRAELYNQSSRVLLHQWDTERALEDARLKLISLDYKDKQAMLRKVAYFMQDNSQGLAGNAIKATDLKQILSEYLATLSTTQDINPDEIAEVLIHQLRARNFILCFLGADYYAFVHRTFLEYFCAWEFVWQFEKARIIDIEYLKNNVFGAHWQDESWHEVLRLITGMLDTKFAGEIIEFLMEKVDASGEHGNLLMAAKCLSEVRNRTAIQSIDAKLINDLQTLINTNLKLQIIEKILRSIVTTWQDKPKTLYWLKNQVYLNNNYHVRIAALKILTDEFYDSTILDLLKQCIHDDKKSLVRKIAIELFIKKHENKSEVLSLLIEVAKQERSSEVVISGATEFDKDKDDKSDALLILKTCAIYNPYMNTIRVVTRELASYYQAQPEIIKIIKFNALDHTNAWIREATIRGLDNVWKNAPETFSILKNAAILDNFYWVRRAAIRELSDNFIDYPNAFDVFFNCVKNDPYKEKNFWLNPRYLAISIIINQYKDRPEVLPLLRDRAKNDPDEQVREYAKQQLENLTQDSKS